ncbi:MAG: MFS transporter, partial [Caldilineaceae bacterium]
MTHPDRTTIPNSDGTDATALTGVGRERTSLAAAGLIDTTVAPSELGAPPDQTVAPMAPEAPLESFEPPIDPADQRRYFFHLYADVAWYGLLAGSAMAFLSVYLTRLGAGAQAIGLLNAGPALVGLLLTLPAGRWLHNRPIGRAVVNTAIIHRMGYAIWIVLPFLLTPEAQIQAFIVLTLVMTVPGTALAVGFNALYAAAVPPRERGRVAGVRNATLAVTYVITSLLSGYILSNLPLQTGYAIVFAIGLVGAAGSTFHLWQLRGLTGREGIDPGDVRSPLGDFASPGSMRSGGNGMRSSVALRVFARGRAILRPEILRTPYGLVVGSLLLFHFAQYIPIALFPLMWVNELGFTDQQISIGTAVFHVSVLIGSLQLARLTDRRGNLWIMVTGVVGLSLYPLIIANTWGLPLYVVASVVGGAAWSMVGGALPNYLLEIAPRHDRPAYLA